MSLYLTGASVTIGGDEVGAPGNFDHLFTKYAGKIPPEFLRETSRRESGWDPTAHAKSKKYPGTDIARGLLQITRVTLADYNANHGTSYTWDDMFDPEINVKVGAASAAAIVAAYASSGIAGLKPDWNDPRWVALLIYGWSAGYSRTSGVIYVAKALAAKGEPITVDTVQQAAIVMPKAHDQLRLDKKVTWAKNSAALYFRNAKVPMAPRPATPSKPKKSDDGRVSFWGRLITVGAAVAAVVTVIGFSKAG